VLVDLPTLASHGQWDALEASYPSPILSATGRRHLSILCRKAAKATIFARPVTFPRRFWISSQAGLPSSEPAHKWRQPGCNGGCLPTIRRAFCAAQCRASPQARDASTWGLQSVQSDGNSLALLYENGRKAKLPFDGEVWLKAYVDGSERTVQVESGTRFRWRVNGR